VVLKAGTVRVSLTDFFMSRVETPVLQVPVDVPSVRAAGLWVWVGVGGCGFGWVRLCVGVQAGGGGVRPLPKSSQREPHLPTGGPLHFLLSLCPWATVSLVTPRRFVASHAVCARCSRNVTALCGAALRCRWRVLCV
jgi:hypothetical protein